MTTIDGPVLLDLNTQRDLFYADGAGALFECEKLLEPLKQVFTWAQRVGCPVISTRLRNITLPSTRIEKPICVPDTTGYKKIPSSFLRRRTEMPLDCGTSLPVDGFRGTQQLIFDLPGLNPFECPRLDRLLSETEAEVWVLIGGPLEWSLRMAVLGLLQRRHKVAIVRDAIGQKDPYEGDMALRQVESKNIEWLMAGQMLRRFTGVKPRKSMLAEFKHGHGSIDKAHHAGPQAVPPLRGKPEARKAFRS